MSNADSFFESGWCRFAYDQAVANWIKASLPAARHCVMDPKHAHWLRCGETWFAGVNALPNDEAGAVPGGLPLSGEVISFIHHRLGLTNIAWDRAQISVCYPGYPRPMEHETEAAFRFRRNRDAAHVDGLMAHGKERRRQVNEFHGFLLGLPMVKTDPEASPFVIWEGSHEIIRSAFQKRFEGIAENKWCEEDITEIYKTTRREIFSNCHRVEVSAHPGEAYLIHRLALHGVAPWADGASAGVDGRMIAYFRPETGTPSDWLNAP